MGEMYQKDKAVSSLAPFWSVLCVCHRITGEERLEIRPRKMKGTVCRITKEKERVYCEKNDIGSILKGKAKRRKTEIA